MSSKTNVHPSTVVAIPGAGVSSISHRLPAAGMLILGLVMLYVLGFATIPAAHNATHDTRHANGFPCH